MAPHDACNAHTEPYDLHYRHGYLQSLPAREYVPIFWQDDELSMLQGTELDGRAVADRYSCLPVFPMPCIAEDKLCNLRASYAYPKLLRTNTLQTNCLYFVYFVHTSPRPTFFG